MIIDAFAPLQNLAAELLPHALEPAEDGAHDLSHLQRVWHNVRTIHAQEGGELEVLLAAVLLHDCVAVEKTRRCVRTPREWPPRKRLSCWPT